MDGTKKYIYSCRVIPPEERDVAHAYQVNPYEMYPAGVGEIRQLSVELTDEGAEAYAGASNLIEIEEETTAQTEGWVERGTELADERASAANFQAIPPTEDTNYGRSTWLREGKRGAGVKVAVLDTALGAATARMLRDYIVGHRSWVEGSALSGTNDHGAHCACTALPDRSKLLHAAVLKNSGTGGTAGIIAAIHWAVDEGADLINLSLSGSGNEGPYERAIRRARDRGVLVFCASGNEAQKNNPKRFPAGCASAIAVGAFDRRNDRRAAFSCHGPHVDLAHSGVSVLSYSARATLIRMSGTSQATPNVVWTAAGLQAETGRKGDALLAGLLSGARKNGSRITHYGAGVSDARSSGEKLLVQLHKPEKPEPPDPNGARGLFPLLKGR